MQVEATERREATSFSQGDRLQRAASSCCFIEGHRNRVYRRHDQVPTHCCVGVSNTRANTCSYIMS